VSVSKVDLHVHSHYSDAITTPIVRHFDLSIRECYALPEHLYQTATARGMDLVTITDHDTISGCLEIAHHGPHVFISEEISARFPDTGCIVHVLAFDIREDQHAEIQRLRFNIFDLVEYLRGQGISHALAHPLFSVNERLCARHVQQCFLLFENLERINTARHPYLREALDAIVDTITPQHIEEWANLHDIEPVAPDCRWGSVAGSDDHSGVAIARGFTEFDAPASKENLLRALADQRTVPQGESMSPVSFAHQVYAITTQYFLQAKETGGQQGIYEQLFRVLSTGGAAISELGPLDEVLRSPTGRVLMAADQVRDQLDVATWERMIRDGATEAYHQDINRVAMSVMRTALSGVSGELVEAVKRFEIDEVITLVAAALQMLLLELPYYFGMQHFHLERRNAEVLHETIGVGFQTTAAPAVAIFVDTLESVNGVSIYLRRIVRELREQGKTVYLLGLRIDTEAGTPQGVDDLKDLDAEAIVSFEPLESFDLPGYDPNDLDPNHRHRLGIPPVLEMHRWCIERQIELIQVSTPGPVGVAGVLIARLLGCPLVGHYHTMVPEYTEELLKDKTVAGIVRAFVGWLYGSLDEVAVPSRATRDNLVAMGLRPEKIRRLGRGVDSETFTPLKRNAEAWERHGLNNATKLLYVGRLSAEKNLDALLESFRSLREEGTHVDLGIVGDGPYRDELRRRAADLSGVAITGYVYGEELAELFASADIFVFPSTLDSFGGVVLEAQASSLPAIVTDMGGPSELVVHNRTGLVVPAGNPDALTDAIRLLVSDGGLRRRMAAEARRHAEKMTLQGASEELWSFYAEHLDRDRGLALSRAAEGI
jgi:glycosyltransferase involved in cell wall biosynthesis/predicted metal-dependent phosphoesterase TrpH